jgi:S-DNA-T family DNA segregation ATPase FtsK/SpoIIIE
MIGQGTAGEFWLDLRSQGPHALVGGTTGAGKSEFLQSWVIGMACTNSPQRVTFLFVDYKGGAAFADCVRLPHCVGLVTDLSPHLVRRALTSMHAELRRREHLLNDKGAKDLVSLERTGDPDAPPALVIVVDEFAALVSEVPEFVDGMVDVAQRGRSLGLHLILATQRPAGVIKDNLRANTPLRLALRMADESDSGDVLGDKMAAHFDPSIPGRGAARTGPGRIQTFQTGYLGGRTASRPAPPRIGISALSFGPEQEWDVPAPPAMVEAGDEEGPTDIAAAVEVIGDAARLAGLAEPRQPWLPELGSLYGLEDLWAEYGGQSQGWLIGVMDDPSNQSRKPVFYDPSAQGNLAVFGSSGSGKSCALRTLTASVARGWQEDPTEVFVIDAGSGGYGCGCPSAGGGRCDRFVRRRTCQPFDVPPGCSTRTAYHRLRRC